MSQILRVFLLRLSLMKAQNKHTDEAGRIGRQIRHIRRDKDVTQEKLAEDIGVSVGWLSLIERGKRLPNLKLLFKIANGLQVKVRDLLPF